MRRSFSLAVLLAAGIVAGLALWLRDKATVEAAPRSGDVGRSMSAASEREIAPTSESTAALRTASSETSAPVFRPASVREPTAGERLELEVVEGVMRRPVADARVVWWSPPGLTLRERTSAFEAARSSSRLDELLVAEGVELVCDAEGRALAPWSDAPAFACASTNGKWGYALVDPSAAAPHLVEVSRDFALDVRVVDPRGAPVEGARVELQCDPLYPTLVAALTGADGTARLEHCGPPLRFAGPWGGSPELVLAEVFQQRVAVAFDASVPPTTTLELRAPAFGSLDVRIVDPRGVSTGAVREVELELSSARGQVAFEPRVTRQVRDGVAHFALVEVGRTCVATARLEGSIVSNQGVSAGPRAAGEHAVLNLIVGAAGVVLRGKLVSPGGVALDRTSGRLHVEFDEFDVRHGGSFETDRGGRLLCELSTEALDGARALVLDCIDELGVLAGRARCALPSGRLTTPVELGELIVGAAPLFAAGVVVDERGAPVAGAEVTLLERSTRGARVEWEALPWTGGRSDAQGRFKLHGEPLDVAFEAYASRGALRSRRIPVRRGATDLRIELEPTGVVEGRLALDASLAPIALRVIAETNDEASFRLASSTVDGDGRFVLRHVLPGEVRLEVVAREDSRRALARLANVPVEAAMETRDPRLEPWDLRALRRGELSFVDELGAPAEDVELVLALTNAAATVVPIGSASFHVYSRDELLEWCAVGAGFLALRHQGGLEDRTFALRRAPTVRFELDAARAHPEFDFTATLRSQAERWISPSLDRTLDFDAQGFASTQPGELARTHLDLAVRRRGARQVVTLGTLPVDIVEAASADSVVLLSPDPEKLEAALRQLER